MSKFSIGEEIIDDDGDVGIIEEVDVDEDDIVCYTVRYAHLPNNPYWVDECYIKSTAKYKKIAKVTVNV